MVFSFFYVAPVLSTVRGWMVGDISDAQFFIEQIITNISHVFKIL